MEYKTISVRRFRSQDGEPTCCANHSAGETCPFLGVRNFGTVDVCMLGEQRDLAPRTNGFQRPDARCEVWSDVNMLLKAKPIQWEKDDEYQWSEQEPVRWGFTIQLEADSVPPHYVAFWGEGDAETCETLDEAKARCQKIADEFIADAAILTGSA